jgi:hypothetical protein
VLVFPMKIVRACPVLFLVSPKQKSRTSLPLPRWYSTPELRAERSFFSIDRSK